VAAGRVVCASRNCTSATVAPSVARLAPDQLELRPFVILTNMGSVINFDRPHLDPMPSAATGSFRAVQFEPSLDGRALAPVRGK
jgi:hypothetical protein